MKRMHRKLRIPLEPLERRDLLATNLLAGISGGSPRSSSPSELVAIDNYVIFNVDTIEGAQLWSTDGTVEGTVPLQAEGGAFRSQPFGDDHVYLSGGHLWRTGGTSETTTALTDNDIDVRGTEFVVFEGYIYFNGRDRNTMRSPPVGGGTNNGYKLMRSDGTADGVEYAFLREGTDRRTELETIFGIWNDELHYLYKRSSVRTFWTTDGTPEGTQEVPYEGELDHIFPEISFDGKLVGRGGRSFRSGFELAVADAHSLDSAYFDINPGSENNSHVARFLQTPAGVFFTATDGEHGTELWTTDGNYIAGTNGPEKSIPVYADPDFVNQVGYSDSTVMVTNFPDFVSGGPDWLTWHKDSLFFSVDFGLWKYSPSTGNVELVKHFGFDPIGFGPRWLTVVGDSIYFSADGGEGEELWKSDGTPGGTVLVADIEAGPAGSHPSGITHQNGDLFFAASTSQVGNELWKFNLASGDLSLVLDIDDGVNPRFVQPRDLILFKDVAFFRVDDGVHGTELWTTDGTLDGTTLFLDINPGKAPSGPRGFYEHNGEMFFVANDGTHGYELWKTDGTAKNTVMVKDIWEGSDAVVDNEFFASLNDRLSIEPR